MQFCLVLTFVLYRVVVIVDDDLNTGVTLRQKGLTAISLVHALLLSYSSWRRRK